MAVSTWPEVGALAGSNTLPAPVMSPVAWIVLVGDANVLLVRVCVSISPTNAPFGGDLNAANGPVSLAITTFPVYPGTADALYTYLDAYTND